MGMYLENRFGNSKGDCLIESKRKPGWFLFDIERIAKTTKFTWLNQPLICFKWENVVLAERFASEMKLMREKINITKFKK